MRILDIAERFITNKEMRWAYLEKAGLFNCIDDRKFLEKKFKHRFGYNLDLDNPKTLNDKLNWLKLYDRNPYYTKCVDKYEVKKIVSEKIGEEYVVPLLGVYDAFEKIDFDELPDSFVLKCTHDGGPVVIKDKRELNKTEKNRLCKLFRSKQKLNYFYLSREWPYKNVKPRIIAEEYIDSLGDRGSIEYKITCCNGKVRMITVCTGIAHAEFDLRNNDHFDREWNQLPFYVNYKSSGKKIERPEQMDDLIDFSERLAEGIPYVRVDWYVHNGRILFGEMTFFTWGGFLDFNPKEWDEIMGSWIELPKK